MLYNQDVSASLSDKIGDSGLSPETLAGDLDRLRPALAALAEARAAGSLPLLGLPYERADLDEARAYAAALREVASDIVVLGIGGSSLGAKAVTALARSKPPARLHFPENLDPETFAELLASLDLATTHFLVVSKSGGTAETLAQAFAAMGAMRAACGHGALSAQFAAIVEPGDSPLRRLAAEHGWQIFDHHPRVGGRFSVLSAVGMIPALFAGLEPLEFRAGAAVALDQALSGASPADVPPAVGAALSVGLCCERGMNASVMLAYSDRLEQFVMWHRQLWAESLGKNGKGITPIRAVGPVDHHSQLQLYLDGPNDKTFTCFVPRLSGLGPRVDPTLAHDPALGYLAGRTIGDLVAAQARATVETLIARKRPVRVFHFETSDPRTMGALMMHFMLETILAAHLLGVDPFDQPAVEEGKVLARAYLAGEAR